MENKNEDKITHTKVTDTRMIMTLKDGTQKPLGAKVTETHYVSGRKDVNIELSHGI